MCVFLPLDIFIFTWIGFPRVVSSYVSMVSVCLWIKPSSGAIAGRHSRLACGIHFLGSFYHQGHGCWVEGFQTQQRGTMYFTEKEI